MCGLIKYSIDYKIINRQSTCSVLQTKLELLSHSNNDNNNVKKKNDYEMGFHG